MTHKIDTLRSALLLTLALAAAPVLAEDASWPVFRGAGATGSSSEALPPGDGPLAFELVWKRPLGSGYSGISIADGLMVTAFTEGERDLVAAFDVETGDERWRYDLAPKYTGHDGSHDGPVTTPTIAGGRVFMISPWGHLVALDLESGATLWTTHLADDLSGRTPLYGYGASPLVSGETIVVRVCAEDAALAGLNVETGEEIWRAFAPDHPVYGSVSSPVLMEIDGRLQMAVLGTNRLAGLDPGSGETLWEIELEGSADAMSAASQTPMVIGDGQIFVKQRPGETSLVTLTREPSGLTPVVAGTGRGLSVSYSPPAQSGDAVYGFTGRFLSAVDPASGELLWRSRTPGDGFLLAVGGQLAVITKKGTLHLGAASVEGWQETAQLELFEDLSWTPPSFAGGSLYLRSLGEMARVRLVRSEAVMTAEVGAPELPDAIANLAATVAAAEDATGAVDAFLADRELPLIDGREVVFLWRGDDDVAIGGDMIGMRREERMERLAGTDLWWWRTEIDARARMSYLFFVGDEPHTDPSHERHSTATILGPDMDWQRGESVEMSWFAMPEWPGRLIQPVESAGGGRLQTIKVPYQPPASEGEAAPDSIEVTMHVWLPPGYDDGEDRYPTVYLHHEGALKQGGWPETLDRVVGQSVAPLIAVFTEWPEMRDYPTSLVVEAIDERFRTRADRESRANIGMAWDGISATTDTFGSPDTFGVLGLQSLFLLEQQMAMIERAVGDSNSENLPLRIYLEWGKWDLISPHEEMNMRRSSKWAFDLFASKGWEPMGGEVWDSTDFSSWRNRTGAMLQALFPMEGASSNLAIWQTGE